jgi:signal peptidase I
MTRSLTLAWLLLRWSILVTAVGALLAVIALVTVPKALGWQGVIVLSGSMEPALHTGGVAFIEPVKPEDVRVGDMVTHISRDWNNSRVTHRVIELVNDPSGLKVRTRGDANEAADPELIDAKTVIGRVAFDLPYLGYAADGLRQRQNFFLLVGLPAALLVLSELWTIGSELRKGREDKSADAGAAS